MCFVPFVWGKQQSILLYERHIINSSQAPFKIEPTKVDPIMLVSLGFGKGLDENLVTAKKSNSTNVMFSPIVNRSRTRI